MTVAERMKTFKLKNGLKVIYLPKKSKNAVVYISVKIGSNYEDSKLRGVSHFLEHMMFEGTKTRSAKQLAKEIEDVGGEMNAATSNETTTYYVYLVNKYFEKALDVLGDMFLNPKFGRKEFLKEKKIVLDELHMSKDDPKEYQWELFFANLFKKHPFKHPLIGYKKTVSAIKHKNLVDYFNKYYVAGNISLIIVGDIKNVRGKAEKYFGKLKGNVRVNRIFSEPKTYKKKVVKEKKKMEHSYLVLGYKVCKRNCYDSYVLDVIRAILSRGQSSRLFEEFRIKRGIGYDVNAVYYGNYDSGYFAVNVSINKKNLKLSEKLILDCLKLDGLDEKELKNAKDWIEGNRSLKLDDSKALAEWISDWDLINLKRAEDYFKQIGKVSLSDVKRVVKKYFGKNYTMVVLEQSN